ncbi:hypothetical protein RB195_017542 [Necator americanus]|uniref:Uncharacterized protein n=1 Tax=Necator americanus TaxID=51031 RepID=A0ABR1C9D6_NECAM
MSRVPSQQEVIVRIDANAKMGLEQQSDVLGKWNKRNHRRHKLTWHQSPIPKSEEQRKQKMRYLKLQQQLRFEEEHSLVENFEI